MRTRGILVGSIAVVVSSALLWLAGEQHRENCIREGRTACSVLPWNNGQQRVATPRQGPIPTSSPEGFFPENQP